MIFEPDEETLFDTATRHPRILFGRAPGEQQPHWIVSTRNPFLIVKPVFVPPLSFVLLPYQNPVDDKAVLKVIRAWARVVLQMRLSEFDVHYVARRHQPAPPFLFVRGYRSQWCGFLRLHGPYFLARRRGNHLRITSTFEGVGQKLNTLTLLSAVQHTSDMIDVCEQMDIDANPHPDWVF